jgi:hypothetical protein
MYMCPEQHLICATCWELVRTGDCVVCRAPYPREAKRHRFLERVSEKLEKLRQKRQAVVRKK